MSTDKEEKIINNGGGDELCSSLTSTTKGNMEELRSMYELPYMSHFVNTKREQFKFHNIDIRTLEVSIWDSQSKVFEDIVCRILRYIKKAQNIRIASCIQHLKSFAEECKSDFGDLVKDEITSISAADKLCILKVLADKTKEKRNELDEMLNEEFGADGQQDETIINVGQDSENRTYWYFDDLRLYRQKKGGQSKTNCDWQCLATDCVGWEKVISRFRKSSDEQEQELHSYLNNHIYPAIQPLLQNQPNEPKKITNEELLLIEEKEMAGSDKPSSPPKLDQSEIIRNENPELSKVLSEEPSTGKSAGQVNGDMKKVAGHGGGVNFTHAQSQLFVFSTQMANKAADSVLAGTCGSILQYHLDDLDTKNFLRANPMTVTLPSQQPRLPMPPQRTAHPFRQPRGSAAPPGPAPPMQWPSAMQPNMPPVGFNPSMMAPGAPLGAPGGALGAQDPHYMNNDMKMSLPGQAIGQPDIANQCVPNENLTPDQRQNRETGLANLRKIHQMLLADKSSNSYTDFSHINMAQDCQGPYPTPCSQPSNSYNNFGINPPMGAPGSVYNSGLPMSPAGTPGAMESKPPPPYPMPSPSTAAQPPAPKKTSRKRKPSVARSPASPLDAPPVKSEKQYIPPSPLAAQSPSTGTAPSQGPPHPSQLPLPKAPQHHIPKSEDALGGPAKGALQQPLSRQQSLPNFPPGRGAGQAPGSYRMMQAGQPTPYQNPQMPGSDAPPSYNNSLRRVMSVESMTAPPTQQQQYLQPENQERIIERQLNVGHQAKMPSDQQFNNNSSTPTAFSSAGDTNLTNITSASLANLAKGMEQNISEMSQKMTQGGPFGGMQPDTNTETTAEQAPPTSLALPTSTPTTNQQQPNVNNTYVNTHMSIGQVNIQNVTANQSYQGPGMHGQLQQHVDVSMNNFAGGMPPGPQPDPMYKPPQPSAAPAVSIQNKGRNTIQYLPVSQASVAPTHDPAVPLKQNFDFMAPERFPSPSPSFLPGEGLHMPPTGPPRHPGAPMYGSSMSAPPAGGAMMPSGAPMHMSEGLRRAPGPQYMMSAQQSSMSMAYNPPPTAPGHPGMMESHMHMRSQHVIMSGGGHPSMHPPPQGSHPSPFPPGAHHPPGPYAPAANDFMPTSATHPMAPAPRNLGPGQQPMMMSHQASAYMGNPPTGPPYM